MRLRWRDYAAGNKNKVMALPVDEFIRRFLLHVLPKAFVRIRHYGLLANRTRVDKIAGLRTLLDVPPPAPVEPETAATFVLRVTGIDLHHWLACGKGRLILVHSTLRLRNRVRHRTVDEHLLAALPLTRRLL